MVRALYRQSGSLSQFSAAISGLCSAGCHSLCGISVSPAHMCLGSTLAGNAECPLAACTGRAALAGNALFRFRILLDQCGRFLRAAWSGALPVTVPLRPGSGNAHNGKPRCTVSSLLCGGPIRCLAGLCHSRGHARDCSRRH